MSAAKKKQTARQREELLTVLKNRFETNMGRHMGVEWSAVLAQLEARPGTLASIAAMERTGGEPDVVVLDKKADAIVFVDCSPQSPAGRWSVCYDRAGLESRKEHRPKTSAVDMAVEMGVELLTEEEYLALQKLGEFDTKTSSWVLTPPEIRALGGAIYCDRRYGRVFTGHNGAQSYYSGRGFRAAVRA